MRHALVAALFLAACASPQPIEPIQPVEAEHITLDPLAFETPQQAIPGYLLYPDPANPQTEPTPSTTYVVGMPITARCQDGWVSYSRRRSGTCSGHGGVREWVNRPAQ